jgi:hypothetical protein
MRRIIFLRAGNMWNTFGTKKLCIYISKAQRNISHQTCQQPLFFSIQYSTYMVSIYMICGRIYDECYCWQFTVLSDGPAQFLERSRITLPSYPILLLAHYLDRFRCFDDFPESYPRFTPPASSHTHTHTRTGDRPVYVYTQNTSPNTQDGRLFLVGILICRPRVELWKWLTHTTHIALYTLSVVSAVQAKVA